MKEIIIDCRDFISRSDLHRIFSAALSFPDHYGSNLDALHDCLTEVSDSTQIVFHSWNHLEETLGRYASALQRAMTHAQKENPCIEILFD